jgi:hypothetical protein
VGPGLAERRTLISPRTGVAISSARPAGFEVNGQDRMFGVSRDGRRFLLSVNAYDDVSGNLVVVQNFIVQLRKALASGNAMP